jgi:hypothetical protein
MQLHLSPSPLFCNITLNKSFFFFNSCSLVHSTLCSQNAGAANSLDFLFGLSAEKLGFDNNGLVGENTLAENLEETLTQLT